MTTSPDSFSPEDDKEPAQLAPSQTEIDSSPVPVRPTEPTSMADLPPEAQGDANGGPLGCCLGVVMGLLLSSSIVILSRFYTSPFQQLLQGALAPTIRILMVLIAIIGMLTLGMLGWKIGKKAYREYDPPVLKRRPSKTRPKK